MSTNISKEKREKLIQKINAIKAFISSASQDENTAQLLAYIADIEKDIKGKKYGLVFEEHRENINEILENNLPVLTDANNLFIDNGGQINFLKVLKAYLQKHNLKGGFVRFDCNSDELCICTENYSDDISSTYWQVIETVLK